MSELDEVYNNYIENNEQYDKNKYIEYKRNEKKEVYELIDTTTEKVATSGDELKKYLDSQSKFDGYSVGNALLVSAQMPKATQLRDVESWKNIGAYRKKFQKPVKILEPGDQYMREDGSTGTNYNVKYVYDITQVTPKQRQRNMIYDNKILLKVFLNSSMAGIQIVDNIPDTNKIAMYDQEKDVLYVKKGAEAPAIFHDVTEELAKQEVGENSSLDSFKCKCVSYMLCKKYSVDVSNFDFSNIPQELKNMEAKEIRQELEPIRDAMENINARANAYIQKIMRENKNKENVR